MEPVAIVNEHDSPYNRNTVSSHDTGKCGCESAKTEAGQKKEYIRLAAGALVFAFALCVPLPYPASIALYIAAYLAIGGDVLLRAGKNILKGKVFDENFLMTIATIGAFIIGEYPEAVAVMLFYQVGERFQAHALDSSRKSITALMDIRPDYANVLQDGEFRRADPAQVLVGDVLRVLPGEKVPLDGVLTKGETTLDVSALTGESIPLALQEGDLALSGSVNLTGSVELRVTKPYGESTVAKILELVQNASERKAKAENFITRFARYYTPAVVGVAALIALVPPLLLGAPFSDWLYRALVFLVVSCPCALVISVPLAFFGGIGACSKHGILVKGGNYLEAASKLDTVVFDKTGTLTQGKFEVTDVLLADGFTLESALTLAAAAEQHSTHPIAKSIVQRYIDGFGPVPGSAQNVTEHAGKGVKAVVDGKQILAGNAGLMLENGVEAPPSDAFGACVYLAVDGTLAARIIVGDTPKPEAAGAITQLSELGVRKTALLTGDNSSSAAHIATLLGIEDVHAELLPGDKVKEMEAIIAQARGPVAFAGDGINDAPVLARSDIGFAMGALGSDAAIEAADIVIMNDDPRKIAATIKLARKTLGTVNQNIALALSIKALVLILSACGIATMWEAVFADVGVALLAILNSVRLLKYKV